MMGLGTFVALSLFFLYWSIMSVEVFGFLNYSQINFPLFYLIILIASGASFRAIDTLDFTQSHRRWLSAIAVANRELVAFGVLLFGAIFATQYDAISRLFIASFLVAAWFFLVLLNRYLPDMFLGNAFSGENEARLALVGRAVSVERVESWRRQAETYGVRVVGLVKSVDSDEFDERRLPAEPSVRELGRVEDLRKIITEEGITHVMLIDHRYGDNWVRQAVDEAQEAGARIWIYNAWDYFFDRPLMADSFDGHTYFTFHEEPLEDPVNRILKRIFDIIVSLVVVIFILPPLCLGVALIQRVQSPGPLFFRQRRLGRQQKPFMVYKFRSMHVDEARIHEARQAEKEDPRIYPFAHFMRRTSIDEIPQFINVLQGDMSVVGPRPHLDKHDEQFARIVQFYKTRNYIKPGITGLAQTRGYRGEIENPEQIRERVRLDVEYISTWSLWLDFWLVLKTTAQVFSPPEAAR